MKLYLVLIITFLSPKIYGMTVTVPISMVCVSLAPAVNGVVPSCPVLSPTVTCKDSNQVTKASANIRFGSTSTLTITSSLNVSCKGAVLSYFTPPALTDRTSSSFGPSGAVYFNSYSPTNQPITLTYYYRGGYTPPVETPTECPLGSVNIYGANNAQKLCVAKFGNVTPSVNNCLNDSALSVVNYRTASGGTQNGTQAQDLGAKVAFCTGAQSMREYQRLFGDEVYHRFTNTDQAYTVYSGMGLYPYRPASCPMNRFNIGSNRATPTAAGVIDIDWFNDIQLGSLPLVHPSITYGGLKLFWNALRIGKNKLGLEEGEAKSGVAGLYEDRKEFYAVMAVEQKYNYQSLWPDSWMNEHCGKCGFILSDYFKGIDRNACNL